MAQTAREASLARRKALSVSGKAAISGTAERSRSAPAATANAAPAAVAPASKPSVAPAASYAPAPKVANQANSARKASLERRIAMSKGGKRAVAGGDRTRAESASSAPVANAERKEGCGCGCGGKKAEAEQASPTSMSLTANVSAQVQQNLVKKVAMNSARAASLSRRKAMSAKGKSALKGGTVSEASAARAANPSLSSRELAQVLRTQRSQKGKTNKKQSSTVATGPGRHRKAQEPAEDQPWKVGVTETASGQSVTGTMVDRTNDVTGNEASTCRAVTGTEYMGADVFRDFCKTDAVPGFNRVAVTSTSTGNSVSGTAVGRSQKVTGDEPGTCKNVTGTEYVSSEQAQAYCGSKPPSAPAKISMAQTMKGKAVSGSNVGRSGKVTGDEPGSGRQLTGSQYMQPAEGGKAPAKVGGDKTLRGGSVSGTMIGRSGKVTGDEPGSCRNVTGDEYVGQGQYEGFCKSSPAPEDRKVGVSQTVAGKVVTGTMTGRAGNVTGDEPGTCKSITGTPYAGMAEMAHFCKADDMKAAQARTAPAGGARLGKPLTGLQPSVGGVMTGGDKGVCEPVSGTPYVGADQMAVACPAVAAAPGSPDFPQSLGGDAPWTDFSVAEPAASGRVEKAGGAVTGGQYGRNGHITGPFGMADGKVTGTEEARFGNKVTATGAAPVVKAATEIDGRIKSHITGEGQDAGLKITGDDWDRGDRVTGTEGTSASRRNPTRRGPVSAMSIEPRSSKRNEEVAMPVSKVTGDSGGSSEASLITYSGGARG